MASEIPSEDPFQQKPATSQPKGPRTDHEQNGHPSKLLFHLHSISREIAAYREAKQSGDGIKKFIDVATLVLLIFTTIGIYWQLHETIKVYQPIRDQAVAAGVQAKAAADSVPAIKGQLTAMQGQQSIMTRQLDEMSAAERLSERAFVNVARLQSASSVGPKGNITWTFTPVFENTGKTPAINIRIVAVTPGNEWIFRETPRNIALMNNQRFAAPIPNFAAESTAEWERRSPSDPDVIFTWPYEFREGFNIRSEPSMGANTSASPVDSIFFYPTNEVGKLFGRFYFGSIHYDDFFGETHISKFCFMIDPAAIVLNKRVADVEPCAHWNCMDESCKADSAQYQADVAALDTRKKNERRRFEKMQERLKTLRAGKFPPN